MMTIVYGIMWQEDEDVHSALSPQKENTVSTKLEVENRQLKRKVTVKKIPKLDITVTGYCQEPG